MKPPACVSCKWGTGTVCEKPSNSVSAKELEARLKEMQMARSQQDQAWFEPPRVDTVKVEKKTSTK